MDRRRDVLSVGGLFSGIGGIERGLEIHGHEIKVSRSDWLRELKDPSKAEAFTDLCDRWWLVVSDAEIVSAGELPPTWGLMVASGRGLRVVVQAPELPATDSPWMPRTFLAAQGVAVAAEIVESQDPTSVFAGSLRPSASASKDSRTTGRSSARPPTQSGTAHLGMR